MLYLQIQVQKSSISYNPNVVQNFTRSWIRFVAMFDKFEMQSCVISNRYTTISICLHYDIRRPVVGKEANVVFIQMCTRRSNRKVSRTTLVTFASIETIASE